MPYKDSVIYPPVFITHPLDEAIVQNDLSLALFSVENGTANDQNGFYLKVNGRFVYTHVGDPPIQPNGLNGQYYAVSATGASLSSTCNAPSLPPLSPPPRPNYPPPATGLMTYLYLLTVNGTCEGAQVPTLLLQASGASHSHNSFLTASLRTIYVHENDNSVDSQLAPFFDSPQTPAIATLTTNANAVYIAPEIATNVDVSIATRSNVN